MDSLEGFLSTFQADLSAVSGQISTLQDRSKDIENKLKSRKVCFRNGSHSWALHLNYFDSRQKIEKPLSSLLSDLSISPSLATTILDTDVDETWLTVIPDFEHRLNSTNARKRVKAARDLSEVTEGLRIVVRSHYQFSVRQPNRILLGRDKNTSILSSTHTTNSDKHDHKYASSSNICVD